MPRRSPRVIRSGLILPAVILVLFAACSEKAPPPLISKVENPDSRPPAFLDVTGSSGVIFTYHNGEDAGHFAIIESLGGGVALVDFDGDGLLDIFLPGGGYFEGTRVLGHPCKLFRNLGGFRFEDVTAKVGLASIAFPYSHGAAAFDYDGDGWPDILVTGYDRLVLLHNEAAAEGRTFVDVTHKAGLTERLWSTAAAWGDLDGDGFPEVYVSHYGNWGFATNNPQDCAYDGKTRDVCPPRRFLPLPHKLYRNNRNGTFSDVSEEVRLRKDGRGIGVQFIDVNNDGRPDIYAANDTDDNFLYVNRGTPGQLALEEIGLIAGVARDDRGTANGSMGVDAGDYDHSGRASILVTNYENELPALYRNHTDRGPTRFTYDTLRSGLSVVGGGYVSWGTGFFDFDRDGWDDLLIVSGHAIRFPAKIDRRQKAVLFRNDHGRFVVHPTQSSDYFQNPHNARGAAFGDLDNDGRIDVVVSHLNEPVTILKNVTADTNWVGLRLHRSGHQDLTGARVVLESAGGRQTKYVKGGGSYASTNDPRLLFGLGSDRKVDRLTVYWPTGRVENIAIDEIGHYWDVFDDRPATRTRGVDLNDR